MNFSQALNYIEKNPSNFDKVLKKFKKDKNFILNIV